MHFQMSQACPGSKPDWAGQGWSKQLTPGTAKASDQSSMRSRLLTHVKELAAQLPEHGRITREAPTIECSLVYFCMLLCHYQSVCLQCNIPAPLLDRVRPREKKHSHKKLAHMCKQYIREIKLISKDSIFSPHC